MVLFLSFIDLPTSTYLQPRFSPAVSPGVVQFFPARESKQSENRRGWPCISIILKVYVYKSKKNVKKFLDEKFVSEIKIYYLVLDLVVIGDFGVVRPKISLGYVKVNGLGETLFFTSTKSEQKLTENWSVKHANIVCFENKISRQNSLPQHDFWLLPVALAFSLSQQFK